MIVIKEVSKMKIIGTEQEIEWVKGALLNRCKDCPYIEPCNRIASEEQEKHGKVMHSCFEYLGEAIEFIIQ